MKEIFDLVWQFAKEVTAHAKNGFRPVTPAEYMKRLKECHACENFMRNDARCSQCGCNMHVKAKWQTSSCPLLEPKWKSNVKKEGKGRTDTDTGNRAQPTVGGN